MTISVVDEVVFWFTVHLEIPYWICSLLCLVLLIFHDLSPEEERNFENFDYIFILVNKSLNLNL